MMRKIKVTNVGATLNGLNLRNLSNISKPETLPITCPKCKSEEVLGRVTVSGYATVNVNTYEVQDDMSAQDLECGRDDVKEIDYYNCADCDFLWEA